MCAGPARVMWRLKPRCCQVLVSLNGRDEHAIATVMAYVCGVGGCSERQESPSWRGGFAALNAGIKLRTNSDVSRLAWGVQSTWTCLAHRWKTSAVDCGFGQWKTRCVRVWPMCGMRCESGSRSVCPPVPQFEHIDSSSSDDEVLAVILSTREATLSTASGYNILNDALPRSHGFSLG